MDSQLTDISSDDDVNPLWSGGLDWLEVSLVSPLQHVTLQLHGPAGNMQQDTFLSRMPST